MSEAHEPPTLSVGAPENTALPLFVYGLIKPGQLGYRAISEFVTASSAAQASGFLLMINGYPLLVSGEDGMVEGELLTVDPAVYEHIEAFQPGAYYNWNMVEVTAGNGPTVQANALTIVTPALVKTNGSQECRNEWSASSDALLEHGLPAVRAMALECAQEEFSTVDTWSAEEWQRYYRVQSAYLLACNVLERIAMFAYGNVPPAEAVESLGADESFKEAADTTGVTMRTTVRRPANPRKGITPGRAGKDFARTAYELRLNQIHRGHGAYLEAELVRSYLPDLHDTLRRYLLNELPGVAQRWQATGETNPFLKDPA